MVTGNLIASRPEDAGIDSEKLEAVFERAKREVDSGIVPSVQIAVARNGKLAGMRTFGSAVQGGIDQPATDGTLYCIYSCTKAVVAAGVWLLIQEGLLRLDERVADIILEFGTNGKDVVTVEHVLLHTAGFPLAPMRASQGGDRAQRLEQFATWRLAWEPDSKFVYHATSAHWVLAEIIDRRAGVDYRAYLRERILDPVGLDELYVGLPNEEHARAADVIHVGEIVEPPAGWGEVTPQAVLTFNDAIVRRVGVPGAGAFGTAAELAMFYQPLVNRGETADGTQVLKPETIEFATKVRTKDRHRSPIINIPVNRGLSIVVAGDDGNAYMRGFGRTCSPRAFGHGGAGGQIGWGDPETGISLGFCTNGFVDYMTLGRRMTALSSLAAVCAA